MSVIGTDPHKQTHTFAAVEGVSGELRSSETFGHQHRRARSRAALGARHRPRAGVGDRGLPARLGEARAFLSARGERVVRVHRS